MDGSNYRRLIVVLALCLPGCYQWTRVADASVEVRWVKTSLAVVQSFPNCEMAVACAVTFVNSVCVVLATTELDDTPDWIVEHEKNHCDGHAHS